MDIRQKFRNSNVLWDTLPCGFCESPYIGNGNIGSYFGQGEQKDEFVFEVSRTDFYDHRNESYALLYKECRLHSGKFSLTLDGLELSGNLELELYDAFVKGVIKNEKSQINLKVFCCDDRDVFIIELEKVSGPCNVEFTYKPDVCQTPRLAFHPLEGYKPYPPANFSVIDGICTSIQSLPESEFYNTHGKGEAEYAVAWAREDNETIIRFYVGAAYSYPGKTAAKHVTNQVKDARKAGVDSLFDKHLGFWHDFYSTLSAISIPDERIEKYYYLQNYRFLCAARKDGNVLDLLGPWCVKTNFPAIWWNMNQQIAYSHISIANHPEFVMPMVNLLYDNRTMMAQNTETGMNDAYCLDRASAPTLNEKTTNKNEVANLAYMLYYLWEMYRMTMDDMLLKEKLLPLMKGALKFMLTKTYTASDGKLHVTSTASPEFTTDVEDCSYTISAMKWLATTIINSCARLGINDDFLKECHHLLDNIMDYPVDEKTGYMIGKDLPLDCFHTHWSHLFMLYPYGEYDFEEEGKQDLINKSFENWISVQEQKLFVGFCSAGATNLYALKGDGDGALKRLNYFFDSNDCFKNGFFADTCFAGFVGPVFETPIGIVRGLQDMLLFYKKGTIHLFHAIPTQWENAEFTDMRTQGAFLISAKYENKKISYAKIESLSGEPCIIDYSNLSHLKCNAQIKLLDNNKAEVLIGKGQTAVFE